MRTLQQAEMSYMVVEEELLRASHALCGRTTVSPLRCTDLVAITIGELPHAREEREYSRHLEK
jgi:hypothetical protein